MKKRLLAIFLCVAMVFSVCACGESEKGASIVTLAEYDDFSAVLTGDYEVTEDSVLEYYYDLMYQAGFALGEITDRAVQAGDIVCVDYTGYLNGEAFDGGSATDQYIDVTNNCGIDTSDGSATGSYIDGFTSGLVGAELDSTISYEVTFPETYDNTDLAGQVTTFEFVIKGIYNELSPEELTDEFVETNMSSNYEVSTVDELMALCEENIAYSKIMGYILDNSEVEITDEYLNERFDLYYNFLVEYYGDEETMETYVGYYGYTLDEAKEDWLAEVESIIQEEVIFAAVVDNDNLKIDEEWYNEYMGSYTTAYLSYWGSTYPDLDEETVEQNFLKQYGYGDPEAGKTYFLNVKAVRDAIIEEYNAEK